MRGLENCLAIDRVVAVSGRSFLRSVSSHFEDDSTSQTDALPCGCVFKRLTKMSTASTPGKYLRKRMDFVTYYLQKQ